MGSSLAVISLALITLLIGIGIAAYQLWSADKAQKEGERSALATRFGGKVANRFEPIERTVTQDSRSPARSVTATSNPDIEAASGTLG